MLGERRREKGTCKGNADGETGRAMCVAELDDIGLFERLPLVDPVDCA